MFTRDLQPDGGIDDIIHPKKRDDMFDEWEGRHLVEWQKNVEKIISLLGH